MVISDSFLYGALIVIAFVIVVRGVEEIRAERRWSKQHRLDKPGSRK